MLVASGVAACSTGDPASPAPAAEPLRTPTYHRDVAPILERSCVKCHHEGGVGPFALTSYEWARSMAPALTTEVTALRMPPWTAHDTSECQPPLPWRDDERLSEDEIDIFRRWDAAGAPEGDPSDASPSAVPPMKTLGLTTTAMVLEPLQDYQPVASDTDELRCFVLDSPAEEGGYVSAIDVIPGNREVVHHVTVMADVDGIASRRAGPDGSFDCSRFVGGGGSVGRDVDGVSPKLPWLLAWAPGAKPLELPPDMGIELPPHSKVMMEVHYSTGGKQVERDRTRLRVVMSPTKPTYAVRSWGVGNYGAPAVHGDGLQPGPNDVDGVEFRVPAGARDHTETMVTTVMPISEPLPIFGLRAHAHYGAVDIKLDVVRDGGLQQCLLQDRWDVHWQRVYTYDAPIAHLPTLYGGEKLRIRCTFDNSMFNRRLAPELGARGLQPMDLTLGDGSMDEMCLVDLLYVTKTN